jgi:hypothetical protein
VAEAFIIGFRDGPDLKVFYFIFKLQYSFRMINRPSLFIFSFLCSEEKLLFSIHIAGRLELGFLKLCWSDLLGLITIS